MISKVISSLFYLIILVLIITNTNPLIAQNNYQERARIVVDTSGFSEVENYNNQNFENPSINSSIKEVRPLSSLEFILSLIVLGFGLFVIGFEILVVFKFKGKIEVHIIIQFIIVTLIITSALFLITAGYTKDQIAPAIGLLGTIAGYLLGRSQIENKIKKEDQ